MATKTSDANVLIPSFNPELFCSIIAHAGSVLGSLPVEIKDRYANTPICLVTDYECAEDDGEIIELRFWKEQINLDCLFSLDGKCDFVIISFTASVLYTDYINYLNSSYVYEYLGGRWRLPNCYLIVRRAPEGVCFSVYPLDRYDKMD